MNTETVLSCILPKVETLLKETIKQAFDTAPALTLYDLEALTQRLLPQVGQVVLQGLLDGQGAGVVGSVRPCSCGARQHYHDRAHPLSVQTSVGDLQVKTRAVYRCGSCHSASYPLDEPLGLGPAGRMSRYLQEQCGWLLALVPARVAQQTLMRFGWPPVAASQIREHAQALGAELEQQTGGAAGSGPKGVSRGLFSADASTTGAEGSTPLCSPGWGDVRHDRA
jgi:hypothetical protein